MSNKLPAMLFYPGDWFKDSALAGCSLATRGAWFEFLLLMHGSDSGGTLTGTIEQFARMARSTISEMRTVISELEMTGAADVVRGEPSVTKALHVTLCNENVTPVVTLINRRMQREERKRVMTKNRVAKHRCNAVGNANVTSRSSSSSSISSSNTKKSAGALFSSDPENPGPEAAVAIMQFPTYGKTKTWDLTADHVAKLADAFPAIDIAAECRKALAWIDANKSKKKTARGMPRFLYSWIERSQNHPHVSSNGEPRSTRSERTLEMLQRMRVEEKRRTEHAREFSE